MRWGSVFVILVFAAQAYASSCALEGAFGYSQMEITNPDNSKAVSEGSSGLLTAQYSPAQGENYSLGLRLSFGYGEYENKASNANLNEETRMYTMGPGIELNVYRVFLGVDYNYNNITVDTSGALENKVHGNFWAPQFFAGVDIPITTAWNLRFYYVASQGDIYRGDSGLSEDSAVSRDSVWISFRYNIRHSTSSYDRSYKPSDEPVDGSRVYRPSRYFSRPSRRLGD